MSAAGGTAALAVTLAAKSGEAAKSGPIGLAVILILCVGCYFLFKSMSKHMRHVREDFPGTLPLDGEARAAADRAPVDLAKRAPAARSTDGATAAHPATDPADPPSRA
jgi:hypothetical protein